MIYQEINLPIWAQLVLIAFWLLALVLLLYIKPREDVKQEIKETRADHVKERYGAYIQLYGKRYN
ncbi:hypothetical protein [Streptococcus infantarius]|uniref:hypothetical protein n=1 Tax=Streptococcus infantarius TaxID=102684 RepID=UPI00293603EB|nr:hypothetical protein [Streptococcus infantarius]MDV2595175.1 hypothetical protein [Streptococcus infantarius]